MRECKQKNCIFLRLKNGCRRCSFCSAEPFIVAEDCPECYNCENVPNACRWGDENSNNVEEEAEKKKEKPIEIEIKNEAN
jgi:hypothetical protein